MDLLIYLVRAAFKIAFWVIRHMGELLIFALVLLLPLVLRTLWFLIRLLGLSIISLYVGVPVTVRRMATSWQEKAITWGFPAEKEAWLRFLTLAAASVTLISGWLILLLNTAWVIYAIRNAIVR